MAEMLSRADYLTAVRLVPIVAIDLILQREDGRFLLGQRNNRPARGFWFSPGGAILKGERIPEAITRIANKEIGFALSPKQGSSNGHLGVWEHFYEDNFAGADGVPTHYIVLPFHFLLRPLQCAAIHVDNDNEDQHGEFHWWSKREILDSAAVHPNCKVYFEQEGLLP